MTGWNAQRREPWASCSHLCRVALVSPSLVSQTRCGHLNVSCWRGLKEFAGSVENYAENQAFNAACHWVTFSRFRSDRSLRRTTTHLVETLVEQGDDDDLLSRSRGRWGRMSHIVLWNVAELKPGAQFVVRAS